MKYFYWEFLLWSITYSSFLLIEESWKFKKATFAVATVSCPKKKLKKRPPPTAIAKKYFGEAKNQPTMRSYCRVHVSCMFLDLSPEGRGTYRSWPGWVLPLKHSTTHRLGCVGREQITTGQQCFTADQIHVKLLYIIQRPLILLSFLTTTLAQRVGVFMRSNQKILCDFTLKLQKWSCILPGQTPPLNPTAPSPANPEGWPEGSEEMVSGAARHILKLWIVFSTCSTLRTAWLDQTETI